MDRSSTRSGFPVTAAGSVGVLAWALPRVSIIDKKGLNDDAIAHTNRRRGPRRMAHDRAPPAGYVQCFRPNVVIKRRQVIVEPRDPPLEAKDIVECERRF